MEQRLEKIQDHILAIRETQSRMMVLIEQNSKDLEHHIRRTDASEKRLELMENNVHQWKGFAIAASVLFTILSTVAHILVVVFFHQ